MKQYKVTYKKVLQEFISQFVEEYFYSFCNQRGFICGMEFLDNDDFCMHLYYKGKKYNIQVIEKEEFYLWHLEPYRQTFFETDLCGIDSFRLVLTAILENK